MDEQGQSSIILLCPWTIDDRWPWITALLRTRWKGAEPRAARGCRDSQPVPDGVQPPIYKPA